MADGARARWFVAGLDDVARAAITNVSDLDHHVDRMLATARDAWPTVDVSDEAFLGFLAARVTGEITDALARLPVADLYLACACASGQPAALRAFEDTFSRDIDATLARTGLPAASADDVKQRLRVKLFVASDGDAPRIVDYTGRGALQGWVRVVAVREALNALRANHREIIVDDSALLDAPIAGDDPALEHMKMRFRAEFRTAVREAMTTLEPRERNLLRQYYLDGITYDKLSTIYRVHLATVARWIEKARAALLAATRRDLMTRLKIDRAEVDSILRLIESRLDVSASDLLR